MKYLFIYAHMDDETILSYGTIRHLVSEGNQVKLLCLCSKGRLTGCNQESRQDSFQKIINELNIQFDIFNCYDLYLTRNAITPVITQQIKDFNPDIVITHAKDNDPHWEHRLVSEVTTVACRPYRSTVKELWYAFSYTQQKIDVQDMLVVDITPYFNDKIKALELYKTSELTERTLKLISLHNQYFGQLYSNDFGETYIEVFRKI